MKSVDKKKPDLTDKDIKQADRLFDHLSDQEDWLEGIFDNFAKITPHIEKRAKRLSPETKQEMNKVQEIIERAFLTRQRG